MNHATLTLNHPTTDKEYCFRVGYDYLPGQHQTADSPAVAAEVDVQEVRVYTNNRKNHWWHLKNQFSDLFSEDIIDVIDRMSKPRVVEPHYYGYVMTFGEWPNLMDAIAKKVLEQHEG